MTTKAGEQKRMMKLFFLASTLFFGLSVSVLAADPRHGAGVIGSMDFESGNYSAYFAALGGR